MRKFLTILASLLLAGCYSDEGYRYERTEYRYDDGVPYPGQDQYTSGPRYYDYHNSAWRYERDWRDLESKTYYYRDSWPYHTRPYYYDHGIRDRNRPDTDYRDNDDRRVRDRDQQPKLDNAIRRQEDRIRDRDERPIERVRGNDRPKDTVRDIERSREDSRARERQREIKSEKSHADVAPAPKPDRSPRAEPRPEPKSEPKPVPRAEPKPSPKVDSDKPRDPRYGENRPTRPSRGSEDGDRVRRR